MRSSSSIVSVQTQTTLKLQPVQHLVIHLTQYLNTTFGDIAFFLATRYMQFLLSLLAPFQQWWACRRKHRWSVSTFTTMGSYVIATGEAATDYVISFHPPMMTTTPYPMNTSSKRGKHHAILRPWISTSQTACSSVSNSYIGDKKAHLHNTKQMQAIVRRGTDSHSPITTESLV
jgi:hypothetical protein